MSTTYSTDAEVYLRAPLVGKALARVNAERTDASLSTTDLDTYRVEAQRQLLIDLAARGITSDAITDTAALREPEVCLAAALLFEAATIRGDQQSPTPDVFGAQAARWRAAYESALSSARPTSGVKSEGQSFSWERG